FYMNLPGTLIGRRGKGSGQPRTDCQQPKGRSGAFGTTIYPKRTFQRVLRVTFRAAAAATPRCGVDIIGTKVVRAELRVRRCSRHHWGYGTTGKTRRTLA